MSSRVGLLRLVAQRVAGPPEPTVLDAVRRLGAVQAQDLPGAITSIALRTAGRSRDDVVAAFDAGEIVRGWPQRGTLHVAAADELRWRTALGSPRPMAAAATRRSQLRLDDADLATARDVALATVPATRDELLAAWEAAGLSPAKGRGYHLLVHLAHTAVLCFGPYRDGEPLIVAVDDWIPAVDGPPDALARWARSYVRGHGPATVQDLARWGGLPVSDARAGLAAAGDGVATLAVDGVEYLADPETPDRLAAARAEAEALHLLPGFDEFVLGYRDRAAVLDPAHADRLIPGNNGVFRATVVVGGRVVGLWRAPTGALSVEAFADPIPDDRAADAHARLP